MKMLLYTRSGEQRAEGKEEKGDSEERRKRVEFQFMHLLHTAQHPSLELSQAPLPLPSSAALAFPNICLSKWHVSLSFNDSRILTSWAHTQSNQS
ncbi:hypothetical protein R1flu_014123 [Riccia fluitans]|uniref:Uncharacterized protein n=1 Tax=Riccia fluitans TaxID=41844 RepID=A0ABD1YIY2_9MARC